MRIVDLKTFVVGDSWRNLIFIRLDTDEGISGCAEATSHNKTGAVLGYLDEARTRYAIGTDPFNIEDLVSRMFRLDFGYAPTVQSKAASAIETACWDIVGKALGQPVWRLLGGKCRDRIPAYANGWYTVDREPTLDPFGDGGLEITRKEKLLAIGIPVATGERLHTRYAFRELIERRAADILQPDVTNDGGLLETKKSAAMGETCYVTIATHNSSGPGCTTASVHPAACTTNFKIQETFDDFCAPWLHEVVRGVPEVKDGYYELPTQPGLGIELEEEVMQQHPPGKAFFNLWDPHWHRRQVQKL